MNLHTDIEASVGLKIIEPEKLQANLHILSSGCEELKPDSIRKRLQPFQKMRKRRKKGTVDIKRE